MENGIFRKIIIKSDTLKNENIKDIYYCITDNDIWIDTIYKEKEKWLVEISILPKEKYIKKSIEENILIGFNTREIQDELECNNYKEAIGIVKEGLF